MLIIPDYSQIADTVLHYLSWAIKQAKWAGDLSFSLFAFFLDFPTLAAYNSAIGVLERIQHVAQFWMLSCFSF
jgi:hypothetical protein